MQSPAFLSKSADRELCKPAGDATFKERFERILEKDTVKFVLASLAYSILYRIRYSRRCDPQTTKSQGHGVLKWLPHAPIHILNSTLVTELFSGGQLDFAMVRPEIQRQYEVDCTYVEIVMEDPFLWYD